MDFLDAKYRALLNLEEKKKTYIELKCNFLCIAYILVVLVLVLRQLAT
jgi:hypothetical protein